MFLNADMTREEIKIIMDDADFCVIDRFDHAPDDFDVYVIIDVVSCEREYTFDYHEEVQTDFSYIVVFLIQDVQDRSYCANVISMHDNAISAIRALHAQMEEDFF